MCPVYAIANETGWPTLGKPSATLKPPERRDLGTDTQGKSAPSGSPGAPSAEKVRPPKLLSLKGNGTENGEHLSLK